jgi:hypothetical protein
MSSILHWTARGSLSLWYWRMRRVPQAPEETIFKIIV